MKKILLLILAGLVAVSCSDEEKIIGRERTFVVKSTTSDWPRNVYGAISRTYEVAASGAEGGWSARLLDGQQGFVLETDAAANTFTVSIGENTGMINLEDKVCVTYSGEMIYLSLLQISNYFSVSPGADMGGGVYKYTVGDDGASTYTGTIANPGTGTVSVTRVSGSELFTPVLEPADKPTSLRFTAPANVTFFPNEAVYEVAVSDKPDQTVRIDVWQPGLEVPAGGQPDATAPGGYYYPLVCGVDVAGVNIPVDANATWNDVFDPELTLGLPPDVTAMTGMDALCHAVEAYTNDKYNSDTERELCRKAVRLIYENLLKVYENGSDIEARQKMQQAAFYAGRAFTRGGVGYVHAIGHAVGGLYGTPHGLAMAIFLPYVMRAYGDAACKKLAELSDVCRLTTPQESDSVKADAFIGWIEELKVKMQIPQYPEMIRKADVKQIAKWAEKEANPLYPTPEVWNRREFERFLLNVCVQGSSEKDRQCCQDK